MKIIFRITFVASLIVLSICTIILFSCTYPSPVTVTVTVTPQPPDQTALGANQATTVPATTNTPQVPAATSTADKKYVGSRQSNKYHLPSCEWAQKISPSNQVWFSSPADAKSKGYVPCKVCKPPST